MRFKQWMLMILLFPAFGQAFAAYQSEVAPLPLKSNLIESSDSPYRFYNLLSKSTYLLGYQTAVIYGLTRCPGSWTKWDNERVKPRNWLRNWTENVRKRPVWDHDPALVNYLGHPWSGMGYYTLARQTGYGPFESFLYSTVESNLVWEYGVESMVEVPSAQDLLLTSTLGSLWGEVNFRILEKIDANDGKIGGSHAIGTVATWLLSPFNSAVVALRNGVRGGHYYHPEVVSNLSIQPVLSSERDENGSRKQGQQMVLSWSARF